VALARLLEIEGQVRLISEFLDIGETLFLLSACDVIVFPYQRSLESASGAVRLGLAAGRPVLTTPLPIFADLSDIVYQLPGTEAWEVAEGIMSLLGDDDRKAEILRRQYHPRLLRGNARRRAAGPCPGRAGLDASAPERSTSTAGREFVARGRCRSSDEVS
jgi:hypothetical protein